MFFLDGFSDLDEFVEDFLTDDTEVTSLINKMKEPMLFIIQIYPFLHCLVREWIRCEMHGMAYFKIITYNQKLRVHADEKNNKNIAKIKTKKLSHQ